MTVNLSSLSSSLKWADIELNEVKSDFNRSQYEGSQCNRFLSVDTRLIDNSELNVV